ncbi:MAG: ATP-binding cassette domain-containing protein, partial [Ginsengibacter sp.]
MHYASVENLSKSFGIRNLFKNISFHVEEGDKIAFVARNGTGKSTLLRIIAGLDTADEGTVWVHKDVKVIMLQQDTAFDNAMSIWDNILNLDNPVVRLVKEYEMLLEEEVHNEDRISELVNEISEANAWNFESDLKQILGKLNLHHLNEPVKNLSGGQRKRVALAQALIESQLHEGKCLLILDEPTNHLDVEMIEWLENF